MNNKKKKSPITTYTLLQMGQKWVCQVTLERTHSKTNTYAFNSQLFLSLIPSEHLVLKRFLLPPPLSSSSPSSSSSGSCPFSTTTAVKILLHSTRTSALLFSSLHCSPPTSQLHNPTYMSNPGNHKDATKSV